MPKKGGPNQKAVAAKEKKDAHAAEVAAKKRQEEEAAEAASWNEGARGKSKKDAQAEKRAAQLARKNEAAASLAEEEKEFTKAKVDRRVPLLKHPRSTSSTSLRGSDKVAERREVQTERQPAIETFTASGIDDALDLMAVATSTEAKVKQTEIERHPERRAKAAFKEYEDRMIPILKAENPGLRLSQLKELVWKQWQKAPENPFNQMHVAHNTSREDVVDAVRQLQKQTEEQLKMR